MRHFIITYKKNEKYDRFGEKTIRISVSNPSGEIGKDAQSALNLFVANVGNLVKNEIISLQEVDNSGNFIGEPIVPDDNTVTVPIKKGN